MVTTNTKKVALVVLDGWGWIGVEDGNAIFKAKTSTMDYLATKAPTLALHADSEMVGLPFGSMGNSEVGHVCIGAGRVVLQDYPQITDAINSGSFFENSALVETVQNCLDNDSQLHIIGILSDAGVHGHIDHILGVVEVAQKKGLKKVFVHAITDGRDTAPKYAEILFSKLEKHLNKWQTGRVASIVGRYFALDRDKHWERIKKAVDLYTTGTGKNVSKWRDALKLAYDAKQTDEFIEPLTIGDTVKIEKNDSIVFTNFRPDRMIELAKAMSAPDFKEFPRHLPAEVKTASMTEYEHGLPIKVAFSVFDLNNPKVNPLTDPLGEVVAKAGLKQLRVAETEKFAHVTYFFNSGRKEPFQGEDRILVPSPRVESFDKEPEMSADGITRSLLDSWEKNIPDLTVVNFANADMVGHTGNVEATVKACEKVDQNLAKIIDFTSQHDIHLLISADHGNAEQMKDAVAGATDKEHSTNPVPLHYLAPTKTRLPQSTAITKEEKTKYLNTEPTALLADIAPTILTLLNLVIPKEMTGKNLLDELENEPKNRI